MKISFRFQLLYLLLIPVLLFSFVFIIFLSKKDIYPVCFQNEIQFVSSKYELDPSLISGICFVESSFREKSVSKKGAVGLMQLMPETAKWICEVNGLFFSNDLLKNPLYNLEIGALYLDYLFKKFENENTVLASYNAGEGNAMVWLLSSKYSLDGKKIISTPFSETNSYIEKVLKAKSHYEQFY